MKKTILLAACLIHTPVIVAAQATDFYVAANVGASAYDSTADADASSTALTLDGQSFDSTETAWGLNVGWQARSWLAFEVGYSDLGDSGTSPPLGAGTPFTPPTSFLSPSSPTLLLPPTFTGVPTGVSTEAFGFTSFGGFAASRSSIPRRASLATTQWHVGAKFRKTLTERFAANWYLGIAHSQFSVGGFTQVLTTALPTMDGSISDSVTLVNLPNAEPDAEFGVNWGAGFEWTVHPRIDVGVQWRRHHTGVVEIDSYRLSVGTRL